MPALLQNMWSLGSSPKRITGVLSALRLDHSGIHLLDLGCGKGAVCIRIAQELGFKVTGVDINPHFLDDARLKAREHSVSDKCTFIQEDIRIFSESAQDFDIVILASLGALLGTRTQTLEILRKLTQSGGYILIEDWFLKSTHVPAGSGHETCKTLEITGLELSALGDRLVQMETIPEDEVNAINDLYIHTLKHNKEEILRVHPEYEQMINDFIRSQEEECKYVEQNLGRAIWLLERM